MGGEDGVQWYSRTMKTRRSGWAWQVGREERAWQKSLEAHLSHPCDPGSGGFGVGVLGAGASGVWGWRPYLHPVN